jgi:hypothetical protein
MCSVYLTKATGCTTTLSKTKVKMIMGSRPTIFTVTFEVHKYCMQQAKLPDRSTVAQSVRDVYSQVHSHVTCSRPAVVLQPRPGFDYRRFSKKNHESGIVTPIRGCRTTTVLPPYLDFDDCPRHRFTDR